MSHTATRSPGRLFTALLAAALAAIVPLPAAAAPPVALDGEPALLCDAGPLGESPDFVAVGFAPAGPPAATQLSAEDGDCPLFYTCRIGNCQGCGLVATYCIADPDCPQWECREQQRDCRFCCTHGYLP